MKYTYLIFSFIFILNDINGDRNSFDLRREMLQSLLALDHKDRFLRSIIFNIFSNLTKVTLDKKQKESLIESIDYINNHNKILKEHEENKNKWIINGVHINYELGITSMSHYSNLNFLPKDKKRNEDLIKEKIISQDKINSQVLKNDNKHLLYKGSKGGLSKFTLNPFKKYSHLSSFANHDTINQPEVVSAAAAAFIEKTKKPSSNAENDKTTTIEEYNKGSLWTRSVLLPSSSFEVVSSIQVSADRDKTNIDNVSMIIGRNKVDYLHENLRSSLFIGIDISSNTINLTDCLSGKCFSVQQYLRQFFYYADIETYFNFNIIYDNGILTYNIYIIIN